VNKKKIERTKKDLSSILNNIWCTYSFEKGYKQWKEIGHSIPEPFRSAIRIELGHVAMGHGIIQARLSVRDEMQKYIDFLEDTVSECKK
jgi:hypothetical protein